AVAKYTKFIAKIAKIYIELSTYYTLCSYIIKLMTLRVSKNKPVTGKLLKTIKHKNQKLGGQKNLLLRCF
ncbi:MAG: hypothetical protein KIH09_16635, partial [Candidatus Freyarchaeota archaeon]|nr:hypothetical protein [Candidatus Jordarchaeia archaeon]